MLKHERSEIINYYLVLINRAGGLYGRILTEVATERSEVCTSDQGQDSPIQTDLAWLIRGLLYGQIRNQKDRKKFICYPVLTQAFSWLTSVTRLQSKWDKNNCSKSSFVQTSSMNEDKITVLFIWAQ